MRSLVIILLFLFVGAAGVRAGYSRLEALGLIESGNNDTAIGRAGEVSRYQIKPWIWRRYSSTAAYQNSRVSGAVAEKYLAELEETFRKLAGHQPDDFDIYVLWNAGPTYYSKAGFSKRRVHPIIRERAQRFVNLRELDSPPAAASYVPPQSAASGFGALSATVLAQDSVPGTSGRTATGLQIPSNSTLRKGVMESSGVTLVGNVANSPALQAH